MNTEHWFESVRDELLARNPFRASEYFRRFAAGTLTRDQAWGHIGQHYLLVAWFPRIFSGIHARCDDLEVRKDCARHLLVEDLGYFRGQVGGTPDHDELFRRIGDDMGYPRQAYDRIVPIPEMAGILGQTVGASRRYDGPFGKSDRAVLIGTLGLAVALWHPLPAWVGWLIPLAVGLTAFTVVRRVRSGLQEIR